ncbi:MAG: TonB-dependent receptor [Gammaproteobacteria bacterium]|nr:TonB-dependent receptor [Gammaproteobacteria bacterium]
MNRKHIHIQSALVLAIAAAGGANHSLAQSDRLALEEIVVTAQKREQSLQNVPISVVVETAATLEKKGIAELAGLAVRTPNLFIEDGGATANIAMRGLGSPGIESIEPSVGLYIDNISFARPRGVTQNPFYDMERIEVLRGPQGTLWGRNTIAGAINMLTARPSEELSGYVSGEAGNYDAYQVEGAVSGPIVDTLSGRLSLYKAERDGYLDNDGIAPDGGGIDSEAYRAQLQWQPNDCFRANLKWEQIDHSTEGHTIQLVGRGPDPLRARRGEHHERPLRGGGRGFQGRRHADSERHGRLRLRGGRSAPAEQDRPRFAGAGLGFQRLHPDGADRLRRLGSPARDGVLRRRDQHHRPARRKRRHRRVLEPGAAPAVAGGRQVPLGGGRLLRRPGDGADAVGRRRRRDHQRAFPGHRPAGAQRRHREGRVLLRLLRGHLQHQRAVDGHGRSACRQGRQGLHRLRGLGAGLRRGLDDPSGVYTEDGGTIFYGQQIIQPLQRDDDYSTWSAKLQYQMNDDTMLYVTAATGYKSGGFNNAGNTLIIQDKVVEEEDSISFEAGAKMDLADGRGRLNLAIFHTTFDDLQVARSDTTGVIVTTNAAEAVTKGVELDGAWRLTDTFTLGGSIAWLNAEYEDF